MKKQTCLLFLACLLLAAGRSSAQDCTVTVLTNTGTTQLNCKNEKITLTASKGFITYAWKLLGKDTTLSSDSTLEVSSPGTYIVSVTGLNPDNTQCATSSSIIITEDRNKPVIDIRAIPGTICKGSTSILLALAQGAATYSWASGSYENPVFIQPDVTASYTVTVTGVNGCVASSSLTVAVNQPPKAFITPPATVCIGVSDQVVTFTGYDSSRMPGAPPYTFTYDINDGPLQTIMSKSGDSSVTIGIPANMPQTIRYRLMSVKDSNGCSSQGQQGLATVSILKGLLLSGEKNVSICNDATFLYKATSLDSGAKFEWKRPAVAGISAPADSASGAEINETFHNSDSLPKEVIYIFSIQASSGCKTLDTVKVTVNPTPKIDSIVNHDYCRFTNVPGINFSSSSPGASFTWKNSNPDIGLPAGGIGNIRSFVAQNNTDTPVTADISVTSFIRNGSDSCAGTIRTFRITVRPAPYLTSKKDISICNNVSLGYKATSSVGSLRWTRPAVAGIINPDTSATSDFIDEKLYNTDTIPKEVKYIFSLSAGGECTTTETLKVIVQPSPLIRLVVRDATVCNQTPFKDTATSTGKEATFKWVRDAVAGISNPVAATVESPFINETLKNDSLIPKVVTYKFILSDGSGCTTTDLVRLTVNPTPSLDQPSDSEYCRSTTAPGINFRSSSPGASFTWTNSNQNIGLPASGIGNIPPFVAQNNTDTAITANITVTSFIRNGSDSCAGTTKPFKITVRPAPLLNTPKIKSVCSGYLFNDTARSNTSGTDFKWVREVVDKITNKADSATSPVIYETLYNADSSRPVVVIYRFTLSAGLACSGKDSVRVTVNPTPGIDSVPDTTVCNGSLVTGGIRFGSKAPGTSFHWTNNNTKIGLADSAEGYIPPFVAQNNTDADITAIITVSAKASADNCPSQQNRTFKIIVKPSPPKPAFTSLFRYTDGDLLAVCKGSENIDFHINAPAPGITYTWTFDTLPGTTAKNVVHIKKLRDSTTVISFDSSGDYIIRLTDTSRATGCTNTATQIVRVSTTTQGIAKQKILPFNSNLLIYPDNSIKAYQWGYDSVIRTAPESSYGRSIPVPGQIYQFFVPPSHLIDPINHVLNTTKYTYWVQLQSEVCNTRVYYNGSYANRVIAVTPVSDTIRVQIIPNPNKGYFQLALSGNISGKIEARIHNAVGRLIFTKSFTKAASATTEVFSLGNLPGGVYFLTLQSSDLKTVVSRFVIQ